MKNTPYSWFTAVGLQANAPGYGGALLVPGALAGKSIIMLRLPSGYGATVLRGVAFSGRQGGVRKDNYSKAHSLPHCQTATMGEVGGGALIFSPFWSGDILPKGATNTL